MACEDPRYTAWLRNQHCCKCDARPWSVVHHHTGRRGKGQRAHDHDGMPLCNSCHVDFHMLTGRFKGWRKDDLRAWQDEQCTKHRALYRPSEVQDEWLEDILF